MLQALAEEPPLFPVELVREALRLACLPRPAPPALPAANADATDEAEADGDGDDEALEGETLEEDVSQSVWRYAGDEDEDDVDEKEEDELYERWMASLEPVGAGGGVIAGHEP